MSLKYVKVDQNSSTTFSYLYLLLTAIILFALSYSIIFSAFVFLDRPRAQVWTRGRGAHGVYCILYYIIIHYNTWHYIILHYNTLHYRLQFCNEMVLASQTLFSRTDEKDDFLEDLTDTCGYFLKPFKIGNNIFQII